MAEDQEREEGQPERPARPSTAAARRERRGTARPAARRDADAKPEKARPAAKAKADSAAVDRKGRPTPTRDRKEDRGSILARIARFLREVVSELRKVIWPTRKQMIGYTAVVLVFVAFMVALVAGLDLGLGKGMFWLFG
ncbi:preprotein translocase subunit SecE [Actinokineospora enzanensis]|uniref:preprotein translocase subunit SecE n=1 Tax=Actinokineospora enzanensis TaxID=155975 RepID=UPI00036D0087|nr:preprotein translocase subunit SecE [Actinokineospora enzanensis]